MTAKTLVKLFIVISLLLTATLWLISPPGRVVAQEPMEGDIGAQAAIGTAFTYQGRLTDGGNPANGSYDLEFKLYDGAAGGAQIGSTITKDNVAISGGLFTVELDFGGSAFDGTARWLQIGVRPGNDAGAYTALSPRQPLNAAPYGLYALQSQQAQSLRAPDGSPLNAVYVDNDGKVGVGTTNPRQRFEVHGGFRFTPTLGGCAGPSSNCYGDIYYLTSDTDNSAGLVLNSQTGGLWADINFKTNGTSRMVIESGGNVGIGTIDPRATLDVNGGLRLSVNANNCAGSPVNCFGYIQGTGPNGLVINSHTGGTWADMHLQTNGVSRLFIESGGNIGIGTTDPRSTLDVNGQTTTHVLQITGGADLAEQFDIQDHETNLAPTPGMVVCIDPARPGELVICDQLYDRTVAGIISGAGGVKPGMVMSQASSEADGEYPISLIGRVYVLADASSAPIHPGDLLTTSAMPGHAMKVTDHEQAQGAILGKAMSSLEEGRGLVLVLVSLQ
ncbi:MAG: hypothetical protein DPW09_22660 [Anaerolineae bacterium]|nr:hypothetical protein [Anaerolineales bacterium]MCQ3976240.1 hypothetical protein [Anaerolineae bacterium]